MADDHSTDIRVPLAQATGHRARITTAQISRPTAIAEGLKHYFTGQPCPRGHIVRRLVSTCACTACQREKDRVRYTHKIESERARSRRYQRRLMPSPTRPCPDNCEMCGGPPTKRALHLDHDHDTGKFRGWLCHRCNTNLGRFGDSEAGLLKALEYLRRARGLTD